MSSLYYEIKKMFIHQRGLLLVGLFFFLNIAGLILFDAPANPDVEQSWDSYAFYLRQVEGRCLEKTEKFMSEEANLISEANSTLQKTYDNYYNGKLSEKAFHTQASSLEAIVQHEKGFELLYEQYTHIRENTDNRYFLYTNGWDGLLSNDGLNLLLMLLILVLITPVFCYEYESKMDSLILTERRGAKHHAMCKIGLVLLAVTLLCLLDSSMRYAFFQQKYGLPHGDYPLQSLTYFNTSTRNITLMGTFLEISGGRLFGYLCFAVFIIFTSVCVRKYALTMFSCTAVILLPYYGLSLQSSKYFLPGPLGFMISTGFFRGDEYQYNLSTEEKFMVFQEISNTASVLLFAITLCIAVAMLAVVLIKHTNIWCARKRCSRIKPLHFALMLCIAVSCFSGCATENRTEPHSIYNMELKDSFENQKYRFYIENSDSGEKKIVFKNKATGEIQNLIRNPIQSLIKVPDSIYGNGAYVYYMKYDYDESEFFGTVDRFSVIQVDTRNFNEKIIFEQNLNKTRDSFLGIGQEKDVNVVFFTLIEAFFIDDHHIYFIGQDQIRRVDCLTGRMSVIIESPVLKTVAFDGKTIYYANSKSRVMQYDTETDKETELSGVITSSFLLINGKIIFLNRRDQNKIYEMVLKDSFIKKIVDESVLGFTLDGETIVYTDKAALKKHRIDSDTQ